MNYAELAATLHHVGERLSKHAGKIEGESMGQSARILLTHLSKFEALLDGYLASRKSGELLLETLLRSPAAKRHLTVSLLKEGLRNLTGKRLRSTDLRAAKREFVEQLHEAGSQDEASEFLQEAFAEAIHIDSGGKDKASLQREFVGLGQLAEDEFAQEIQKKSLGELRRLAETNGIRFTDKTNKQRLAALVRRYARRAVFNISAAA
ncbi:MAG TPA: hypothetical protein VGY91_00640 [Chthoniobacterales bacterium]|jgi:hypothetical protein|nr:hypothetical protein [Chthoniobacterales bacterium]